MGEWPRATWTGEDPATVSPAEGIETSDDTAEPGPGRTAGLMLRPAWETDESSVLLLLPCSCFFRKYFHVTCTDESCILGRFPRSRA